MRLRTSTRWSRASLSTSAQVAPAFVGERQELAHPSEREPQFAGAADEVEPLDPGAAVHAMAPAVRGGGSIRPRPGESFLSRHRRPIVDFVEDGADGVHDMLLSACDAERYAQLGHVGPHASCAENCKAAMHAIGHQIDVVPQPVNFFTNTHVDADGRLTSPPNPVPPGAYVELEEKLTARGSPSFS